MQEVLSAQERHTPDDALGGAEREASVCRAGSGKQNPAGEKCDCQLQLHIKF